MTFPHLRYDLVPHYLRGFFDGDGCVSATNKGVVNFTGMRPFLERVQHELNTRAMTAIGVRGCLARANKRADRHPDTAQLIYGGRRSLTAIYNLLYTGATRFLLRKHEKFLSLLPIRQLSVPAENAVKSVTAP